VTGPFVFEGVGEAKRFAPATLRNRDYIVDVLRPILPESGTILEVASGTGEHIVHFASAFPHLRWQPSDYDAAGLASISAWATETGLPNIAEPVQIDAASSDWAVTRADAILCINMVHIAPWSAAEGLFAGAGRLLPDDGMLYLYGPFRENGVETAESNLAFDRSLQERNPQWGLRYLNHMVALGTANGLDLAGRIAMPANNLSLVFRKTA
jgi:SAM-dependent methyltransferase